MAEDSIVKEFLMAYGRVILAVLAAFEALAYYGVNNSLVEVVS